MAEGKIRVKFEEKDSKVLIHAIKSLNENEKIELVALVKEHNTLGE